MSKVLKALAITASLGLPALALPTVGMAAPVTFGGSYDVDANTVNPGLTLQTGKILSDPFTFILDGVNDSETFSLFNLWTDELEVNANDLEAKAISVAFNFTLPFPGFDGTVPGQTIGITGLISQGTVTWADPIEVAFGAGNDGLLRIDLDDAFFNTGSDGNLIPGAQSGAVIGVTFTLLKEASTVVAAVPEPMTMALVGTGLLALGYLRRRQQG